MLLSVGLVCGIKLMSGKYCSSLSQGLWVLIITQRVLGMVAVTGNLVDVEILRLWY